MPTEVQTGNIQSQSSKEGKTDIATMPMADYNKHSSYQAEVNQQGNKLLTESAKHLMKSSPDAINIADFGCSHGKNSMECIKSALDGYLGSSNPVSIMIYLNDLPTNDFGEVFKCLNDPALSVYEHPLFEENPTSTISVMVNGKSFNNQVFPKDHINLSFSFNCLHWMEKPVKLSKGIIPKSSLTTPEENATIAKDAHEQLVRFLRSRAIELKTGGRFICSIIKDFQAFEAFDRLWESFVQSKGFEVTQFGPVSLPNYFRTTDEIVSALDEVKDQFKVVSLDSHAMSKGFTPKTFKAVSSNTLARGIKESKVLANDNEIKAFVDGFYDSFPNQEVIMDGEFQLVALERI